MIDRVDTVAALKTFIDRNPEFKGGNVVPFGTARDSASIQTYFSADLLGSHIAACKSLSEVAQAADKAPLIFVDDFVGSGGQGQDILAAGFGVQELRRDLGEQRELFDGQIQEYLRKAKVGFVFTAAWKQGIATLRAVCIELGINAVFYQHIDEDHLPFAFEGSTIELDQVSKDSFKSKCCEVGRAILSEEDRNLMTPEKIEKIENRLLGYGNKAMLLASPFNVPTQTLTVVWAEGVYGGVPWAPLMPRRKKT
jgi:deoxynucleoside triphosphate triphosphohydrolase SAMHD1